MDLRLRLRVLLSLLRLVLVTLRPRKLALLNRDGNWLHIGLATTRQRPNTEALLVQPTCGYALHSSASAEPNPMPPTCETSVYPGQRLMQTLASNGTDPLSGSNPSIRSIERHGNPSAQCTTRDLDIMRTVVCDPLLISLARTAMKFPDPAYLDQLCAKGCVDSLEALRAAQLRDCSANDTIIENSFVYPATYRTDLLLYATNYLCQTNSSGGYCFPTVLEANNGNDMSLEDTCSDCNLKTMQALLNSPFGWGEGLAASYSAMTQSCQVTSLPVASPSPYVIRKKVQITLSINQASPSKLASPVKQANLIDPAGQAAQQALAYFPDPCLNPGAPSSCFKTYPVVTMTAWPNLRPAKAGATQPALGANKAAVAGTPTSDPFPDWTDPATLPLASGTKDGCAIYDKWTDISGVAPDTPWLRCCNPNYCSIKADSWGITLSNLTAWNPSLSTNKSDESDTSCAFQPGLRYCVQTK
ncbi:hypothetical protein GQ53DRAFT_858965 [Thozetella sp. PMI_491]|nr:hypothetical protein GQ53DRAFT_858965 [Thozetella sp. PMI_491]